MKKALITLTCLIVALILIVSLGLNLLLIAGSGAKVSSSAKNFEELQVKGSSFSGNRVAVIDLFGVISYGVEGQQYESMVDDFIGMLQQARDDNSIKAIVIRIDSPGGEVTASDVIYHEISKTDAIKPVVIFMESVAASGGYYSAVGGRYIMANELTITGSIGVILQTINIEGLTAKIGVTNPTFKSGKMKDILSPTRAITDEERLFIQAMIDETYGKFVGIVAKERALDETELRAGVADGRIVSGKAALKAGLIDQTGYYEDALNKAREFGKLDADAPVIRLIARPSFSKLFRLFGQAPSRDINIQLGPQNIKMEAGKLYFMSQHLFLH
ncbi:MAG: signal peptide peptidase SppA [Blastochloris sp.]|nr:signal peptide peptidase SppA [Blastochloris sp.]